MSKTAKKEKKAKEKVPKAKAEKAKKEPRITKKAVIIDLLQKGATIQQMAAAIVKAKLGGDQSFNERIVRLWLPKIGFAVKRDAESGIYAKAARSKKFTEGAESKAEQAAADPKAQ